MQLTQAIKAGNLEQVKKIIEENPDIIDQEMPDCDFSNYQLLHYAALLGQLEIVKYLMEKGAKIEDSQGYTVLYYAAVGKQFDVVRFLNEAEQEPNPQESLESPLYGVFRGTLTPLHQRLYDGWLIVRYLLEHGWIICNKDEYNHHHDPVISLGSESDRSELIALITKNTLENFSIAYHENTHKISIFKHFCFKLFSNKELENYFFYMGCIGNTQLNPIISPGTIVHQDFKQVLLSKVNNIDPNNLISFEDFIVKIHQIKKVSITSWKLWNNKNIPGIIQCECKNGEKLTLPSIYNIKKFVEIYKPSSAHLKMLYIGLHDINAQTNLLVKQMSSNVDKDAMKTINIFRDELNQFVDILKPKISDKLFSYQKEGSLVDTLFVFKNKQPQNFVDKKEYVGQYSNTL